MIMPLLATCVGWCEDHNSEEPSFGDKRNSEEPTFGDKQVKEQFVFKGLYLGMPVSEARKILRSYGLDFDEDPSNNNKLGSLVLSRNEIDTLFKTEGVSAERFCKTLMTAYPVIKKFSKRTETIFDVQRQRKLMSDAGETAFLHDVFSGVNPLVALSNSSKEEKRVYEDVKTMTKDVPVYYYESPSGFLLEIRPEQPMVFFVLKLIAVVDIKNFD